MNEKENNDYQRLKDNLLSDIREDLKKDKDGVEVSEAPAKNSYILPLCD